MKKKIFLVLLFILVAAGFSLRAYADELNIPVEEYTLSNGIRVLIVERHNAPIFSAHILFKVGSLNDPVGLTGVAHMLEHMMFKGTKTIGTTNYEAEVPIMKKIDTLADKIEKEKAKGISNPQNIDWKKIEKLKEEIKILEKEQEVYLVPNELDLIYQKNGADGLNAFTSNDVTDYVISLPSNKFELWAYLESDRLKNPVFRMFTSERDTIMEERKQSVESKPYGRLEEEFNSAVYESLPYHHPVIGWPSDIDNFKAKDVMEVFKKNYSPQNIVIGIVGDVNPDETIKIIKKYFGDLRNYGEIRTVFTEEMNQKGQREIFVAGEAKPMLKIGFHGPKPLEKDMYVLDVVSNILSSGKTSRLYRELVENKKIATSISFGADALKYASVLTVSVYPADDKDFKLVENEVFNELEKLKKEKVSPWELEKAKNNLIAGFVRSLEDNYELALSLAYNEGAFGSWRYFDSRKEYSEVTAEDIQKAAQKYFNKENSTVVILTKPVAAGL